MTEPFIDPSEMAFTPDDQVAWATARIREYCRWHIFPSIETTKTVNADGGKLLVLPTLHLTAVGTVTTHVWCYGSPVVDTVVDPLMVTPLEYGVIVRRDLCWPVGPASVTATFTHGYAELPEALREVAVAAATRIPAAFASVAQEAAGGVSRTYAGLLSGQASLSAGWTFAEQTVLDMYRLPPRA